MITLELKQRELERAEKIEAIVGDGFSVDGKLVPVITKFSKSLIGGYVEFHDNIQLWRIGDSNLVSHFRTPIRGVRCTFDASETKQFFKNKKTSSFCFNKESISYSDEVGNKWYLPVNWELIDEKDVNRINVSYVCEPLRIRDINILLDAKIVTTDNKVVEAPSLGLSHIVYYNKNAAVIDRIAVYEIEEPLRNEKSLFGVFYPKGAEWGFLYGLSQAYGEVKLPEVKKLALVRVKDLALALKQMGPAIGKTKSLMIIIKNNSSQMEFFAGNRDGIIYNNAREIIYNPLCYGSTAIPCHAYSGDGVVIVIKDISPLLKTIKTLSKRGEHIWIESDGFSSLKIGNVYLNIFL